MSLIEIYEASLIGKVKVNYQYKASKIWYTKGRSPTKKTVKKGDIVRTGRGGVNPSSFFKPKFTGFSNHSEMDF